MQQLTFNFLTEKETYNFEDFLVFNSNLEAYTILIDNENNECNKEIILLYGPEKSGKTYLANLWKIKKNAKFLNYNSFKNLSDENFNEKLLGIIENYDYYIIDDFDYKTINEKKLFHLINIIYSTHSKLLLISNKDISTYIFSIKDLKSRINSCIKLKIKELSNEDKKIFIIRLLASKKLILSKQTINYIEKISPDTYKKIYDFIEKIDSKAKQENKKITIPFIKRCLFLN